MPYFAIVGTLTISIGVLRGTVFGPLTSWAAFASPFGATWLLALVIAVLLAVLGAIPIGQGMRRFCLCEKAVTHTTSWTSHWALSFFCASIYRGKVMKFIHSADWQIGKVFKRFGGKEETLQSARLDAIETLGYLAAAEGVGHVVVAGDVYDNEAPSAVTLRAPLERMRQFPLVTWHLLPGNHDPHRPEGIWDRVNDVGLPSNVRLCLESKPSEIEPDVFLLPCPLLRKSEVNDLTAWMNDAVTPASAIRIGLAHGAVVGFGTEGEASNQIDPARQKLAGLDYLALGDWHRTIQINPGTWYAGTPEPDRTGSQEQGKALIVDIPGPGVTPNVREAPTGRYQWITREFDLVDGSEFPDIETQIRSLPQLSKTVLRLRLRGTSSLAARAGFANRQTGIEAALFSLDVDLSTLMSRPTDADLESIDFDGVLRQAADRLKLRSEDSTISDGERHIALEALTQLYVTVNSPSKVV